jgi:arginine decarboxylase
LHVNSPRIDVDRVSRSLRLLQTTSPSYLLLASLDAARQQMALHGTELMAKTIELARIARDRIDRIDGLSVLKLDTPTPGWKYLDPTRLTVTVTGLNLTGFEADEILTESARSPRHQGFSIVAELPSVRHLTFIISLGNTLADIDRLVEGFTQLASNYDSHSERLLVLSVVEVRQRDRQLNLTSIEPPTNIITQMAITPRQADRSPHITVPCDRAVGKISAESICPYPPGIPVLIPGEIITATAMSYLQKILDLGGEISGCSDPTLETIRIVVE